MPIIRLHIHDEQKKPIVVPVKIDDTFKEVSPVQHGRAGGVHNYEPCRCVYRGEPDMQCGGQKRAKGPESRGCTSGGSINRSYDRQETEETHRQCKDTNRRRNILQERCNDVHSRCNKTQGRCSETTGPFSEMQWYCSMNHGQCCCTCRGQYNTAKETLRKVPPSARRDECACGLAVKLHKFESEFGPHSKEEDSD